MKPNIFVTAIIYVAALTACVHTKRVTISTSTNGKYQKIEYAGNVAFTVNDKAMISMSPNSWVQYKENDLKLNVECDREGHIHYSLNGDEKTDQPTPEEQTVLERAALLFNSHSKHS